MAFFEQLRISLNETSARQYADGLTASIVEVLAAKLIKDVGTVPSPETPFEMDQVCEFLTATTEMLLSCDGLSSDFKDAITNIFSSTTAACDAKSLNDLRQVFSAMTFTEKSVTLWLLHGIPQILQEQYPRQSRRANFAATYADYQDHDRHEVRKVLLDSGDEFAQPDIIDEKMVVFYRVLLHLGVISLAELMIYCPDCLRQLPEYGVPAKQLHQSDFDQAEQLQLDRMKILRQLIAQSPGLITMIPTTKNSDADDLISRTLVILQKQMVDAKKHVLVAALQRMGVDQLSRTLLPLLPAGSGVEIDTRLPMQVTEQTVDEGETRDFFRMPLGEVLELYPELQAGVVLDKLDPSSQALLAQAIVASWTNAPLPDLASI